MILSRSNDALVVGHCPQHHFRVVFADVAEATQTLAERHACGPTAALVLAESLLSVALASADIDTPDETACLRFDFDGPVGGAVVEAAGGGFLRGYTRRKVLEDLDESRDLNLQDATGPVVRVQFVRAKANGELVSRSAFTSDSGLIRDAMLRYYAHSLQVPAHASYYVSSYDGRIDRAVAVVVQRLPDGDRPAFDALGNVFAQGSVAEWMRVDTSLDAMRDALKLPALTVDWTRPLAFGCRCSRARAEAALAAMSVTELNDMRRAGHGQHVTCQMCGADHWFTQEDLGALIARAEGSVND